MSIILVVLFVVLACAAGYYFFAKRRGGAGDLGISPMPEPKAKANASEKRSERAAFQARQNTAVKQPASPALARPKVDISDLPITRLTGVPFPPTPTPLEASEDPDLLAAIEELQSEEELEAEFRLVALRVVAAFRSSNSVEALTQAALYDLSSSLRATAVLSLAEIDHESVFEPIIMAGADPSREVRAAGARAMSKLTIDRGAAWARAVHSQDTYASRQLARAAVESGIAERLFERLAMRDDRAVFEAFTLVNLLIRSGETDKIFETISGHRDDATRLALLHAIKAAKATELIPQLTQVIANEPMSSQIADKAREVILEINAIQPAAARV